MKTHTLRRQCARHANRVGRAGVAIAALFYIGVTGAPAWAFTDGSDAGPAEILERVSAARMVPPLNDDARQKDLRTSAPWSRFLAEHGDWTIDFDLRSFRPRRMLGEGIPMMPGPFSKLDLAQFPGATPDGSGALGLPMLEALAKGFLAQHQDLFRLNLSDWHINAPGTQLIDDDMLQVIALTRRHLGIEVAGARITLAIKGGNLIYVHGTLLDDLFSSVQPQLTPANAIAVAVGNTPGQTHARKPVLRLAAVGDIEGRNDVRLVWELDFTIDGYLGTWRATVDANSGEVISLYDNNAYQCALDPNLLQGRVMGGIRPALATDPEVQRYFPFTNVTDDLNPEVTDYNGWYYYSGQTASSSLAGQYFNVTCNGCPQQPFVANSSTGYLDFGFGGTDQNGNGMSTPADRTAFYHLNVSRAIGGKWTNNPWFDTNIGINTNINQACNAFWNGTSVNFFRSNAQCFNTGEIADIMQHEWGHGLDGNDGVPPVGGDRATGEAIGDLVALFVDHDSCIGPSFFRNAAQNSGPYCLSIPSFNCPVGNQGNCTGVRNIDERLTSNGIMTTLNIAGECGPSGGCAGPLGFECHCEGEIYGQVSWHLANNLLTGRRYSNNTPLAGANPAYSEAAAWYIHERLFFNALAILQSYAPSNLQTLGPSAYDAYVTIDDDDGNLANGTPNAEYINDAFIHHNTNEPTRTRTDSANCTPPADPAPTVTPLISQQGVNQVEITWAGDPTASFYEVYRREDPTDAWLPVRQNVLEDGSGGPWTVIDEPVQNALTYYYNVVSVNSVTACVSPGANSQMVTIALPDLDVSSFIIDDSVGGNGNGVAEPGETFLLNVSLEEVSNLVGTTNVSATLVTDDPLVIITDPGPVMYGAINLGQTRPGLADFDVAVTLSKPCPSTIPLKLLIESDDGCWLKAFSLAIPGNCAIAPGAEASYTGGSFLDVVTPSCGDGDCIGDVGETGQYTVTLGNPGSLPATGVSVLLTTTSPGVAITSANPFLLAGPLAPGGSAVAMFSISINSATCGQRVDFTATVDSNENVAPLDGTQTLPLAADFAVTTPTPLVTFEAGNEGWAVNGFTRSNNRANGGVFSMYAGTPGACNNGNAGANLCATLTSPPLTICDPNATCGPLVCPPAAGPAQMVLFTWYSIEAFGGQWWDRANVHVIDGNSHVLITPASGRAYNGGNNDSAGLCHNDSQNGWAGSAQAWAQSTFNLSAYAGRTIQIEINYNTDGAAICEGIYVDDIQISNVVNESCDGQICTAPCSATSNATPAAPPAFCEGGTIQLDGSSSVLNNCSGATEYQWVENGNPVGPFGPASTYDLPTSLVAGSYTYDLNVRCSNNTACTDGLDTTIDITIDPPPQLACGTVLYTGVEGTCIPFGTDATTDATGILWNPLGGGIVTNPSSLNGACFTAPGPGVFDIELTVTEASCTDACTIQVDVSPSTGCVATSSATPGASTTICEGQTLDLDGIGSGITGCTGSIEYQWIENGTPVGPFSLNPVYTIPGTQPVGTSTFDLAVRCSNDTTCIDQLNTPIDITVEAEPEPVDVLLAVETATPDDVEFSWNPAIVGFFRVNSVDDKTLLPAYAATGATERCFTADSVTLTCTHPSATPGNPVNVLYYSVVGVCSADPTVEGP